MIKYQEEKYSKNYHINQIIYELLEGSDLESNLFSQLQDEFAQNFNKGKKEGLAEGREEGIIEGINLGKKEEQLITAYKLITNGKVDALQFLSLDFQYKEKEVLSILKSVNLHFLGILLNYLEQHRKLVKE